MKKTIRPDKDGKVSLKKFQGVVDIDRVVYYSLKRNEDGTISVKFYDKNKKLVKPYKKEKACQSK